MTNDEIKELIQLVVETGIAELEVQHGEDRVRIRRTLETVAVPVAHAAPQVIETAHTGAIQATAPAAAPPATTPQSTEHVVKSPIVGTYYDAPKPGDPPFVNIGDDVEPGKVLCIIESMKLMNEIESEVAGTVTAKLLENGRPVEYGEPLFNIRPR